MAGVEGFEPPITDSESVVLPLDDTPLTKISEFLKIHLFSLF